MALIEDTNAVKAAASESGNLETLALGFRPNNSKCSFLIEGFVVV
jgi:hypothetical protein